MDYKVIQKPRRYFTETEKHEIIQAYLTKGCTKQEIWRRFTGDADEHGHLLRWMRQLGYTDTQDERRTFVSNLNSMSKKKKAEPPIASEEESFENLQLKKRITELEKQLKDAELKAIAFSTMVDIAEKEFKIPIRKKFNTKP
jgi:transposase